MATLTYVYKDSTVVLGPMATTAQPHTYDLCRHHVETLKPPRGWTVHQLVTNFEPLPPAEDDLDALAAVVRKASQERRALSKTRASGGRSNAQSTQANTHVKDSRPAHSAPSASPHTSGPSPSKRHSLSQDDYAYGASMMPPRPGAPGTQRPEKTIHAGSDLNTSEQLATYDQDSTIRVGHLRLIKGEQD